VTSGLVSSSIRLGGRLYGRVPDRIASRSALGCGPAGAGYSAGPRCTARSRALPLASTPACLAVASGRAAAPGKHDLHVVILDALPIVVRTSFVPETSIKAMHEVRTFGRGCVDFTEKKGIGSNERLEVSENPNHRRPDDPEAL
jgi:hypothetical protein